MIFTYRNFNGIRPKLADHLLPRPSAVVASQVEIESGELRPLRNNQEIEELESITELQTIYFFLGTYWFEFDADVDVQESPVDGDTANRIYYTGDGLPKKTNLVEATTGAGAMPINFYPLAVPTPDVAASVALGAGGSGDTRDITYVWTVVTSWGEEGAPSPASTVVSALQGQTVELTGMSLEWQAGASYAINSWVFPSVANGYVYRCVSAGVSDGSEPTFGTTVDGDTTDNTVTWRCYKDDILTDSGAEKRIYRANTGTTGAVWTLLDTISMATEAYTDTTADDELESTVLPSEDWNPPQEALKGLTLCSGGFFAGFVGKDLYLSEPYRPHAWPYSFSVASTIVGLSTVGNVLVVMTTGKPVLFNGTHPSSLTPTVLDESKKCVSKKGIVSTKHGVFYPSNDSLQWIDGVNQKSFTEEIFSSEDWQEYYPTTMHSVFHDGKYYGFYSSGGNEGGIVIDLSTMAVTTLDFYPVAAFVDVESENMYFVDFEEVDGDDDINHLYQFAGDPTQPLPSFVYRFRQELTPRRIRPAFGRILFDEGDLIAFHLWVSTRESWLTINKQLFAEGAIDGAGGRPGGGYWFSEVPIAGSRLVDVFYIEGTPYSITTVPVYAGDLSLTFKIYKAGTLHKTVTVTSQDPFRIGVSGKSTNWQVEVTGNVERIKRVDVSTSVEEMTMNQVEE